MGWGSGTDAPGIGLDEIKDLPPLLSQTLDDEERARLENFGHNGPRDVAGLRMTHCVPDEHVRVAEPGAARA